MEGLRDAGFYGVDVLKEQIRELDELEDTKRAAGLAALFVPRTGALLHAHYQCITNIPS